MNIQMYNLHLINGAVISVAEDYNLPIGKGLIGKYRAAKMDDILCVNSGMGFSYIPKRNIVFIETGEVIAG